MFKCLLALHNQARRNIGRRLGFANPIQPGGDRMSPEYMDVPTNF